MLSRLHRHPLRNSGKQKTWLTLSPFGNEVIKKLPELQAIVQENVCISAAISHAR
jgi:hypothetical protein